MELFLRSLITILGVGGCLSCAIVIANEQHPQKQSLKQIRQQQQQQLQRQLQWQHRHLQQRAIQRVEGPNLEQLMEQGSHQSKPSVDKPESTQLPKAQSSQSQSVETGPSTPLH